MHLTNLIGREVSRDDVKTAMRRDVLTVGLQLVVNSSHVNCKVSAAQFGRFSFRIWYSVEMARLNYSSNRS
jgi:hypothetical protein